MILVHAGNRTDADDRGGSQRFPEANVADVEQRVGQLLESLRPTCVVTSAAAGADLILLNEACRRDIPVRAVLPLLEPLFIERSVADRGAHWLEMYRSFRGRVPDEHVLVTDLSDDEDWYLTGNDLILDAAQAVRPQELVVAVTIRRSIGEDPPSATDDFAERARHRGIPLIGIDPSIRLADLGRAFVIMPFGEQPDPATDGPIDFDSVFDRLIVPALVNASLRWQRSDTGLLEQVTDADVVVVDLTIDTTVYDDLRSRDVVAPRTIVLLARGGATETSLIRNSGGTRQLRYALSDTTMSYEEAFAAYTNLRDILGA